MQLHADCSTRFSSIQAKQAQLAELESSVSESVTELDQVSRHVAMNSSGADEADSASAEWVPDWRDEGLGGNYDGSIGRGTCGREGVSSSRRGRVTGCYSRVRRKGCVLYC